LIPVAQTSGYLPLVTPWAAGDRSRVIRIQPDQVFGRRLIRVEP
jgi:hypothetical protein